MRTHQFYVSIDPLYVRKPIQWLKESYVQAIMPLFWQELGNIHFFLEGALLCWTEFKEQGGPKQRMMDEPRVPLFGDEISVEEGRGDKGEAKKNTKKYKYNANTIQIQSHVQTH